MSHIPRKVALLGGTTSTRDCVAALRLLMTQRRLLRGPEIREYEEQFARTVGVPYAYSFGAGRVGLYGILRALGVRAGDEVLLQVPTHIVVSNAIRHAGAQPVYVDCRGDDFNIDLTDAERRVTPRTRALVVQHTFGVPADIDGALELARRHGLELIEDCVHALGARYAGRPVGGFGRAAFFSTEETKTISTTMGGMVVTSDPELASRLESFQAGCAWPARSLVMRYLVKLVVYQLLTAPRVHYYARALYETVGERHPLPRPTTEGERRGLPTPGFEQRLSNAQAVIGLLQLRRLNENLAHRRAVADAYGAVLSARGAEVPAANEPGAAFVRYPLWANDRESALAALSRHAVPGTWFTSVLEEAVSPRDGGYDPGSCPEAEAAAAHLINLPTHPRVRRDDADKIAAAVASEVRAASGAAASA